MVQAMAWRINALHVSGMIQLAMNWGLSIGALVLVLPTVWTVSDTTIENPEFEGEVDEKMNTEESE
jgi:hypothetical protein